MWRVCFFVGFRLSLYVQIPAYRSLLSVGIIFFTIIFPKRPGETEEDEVARLSKIYEVLNVILGLCKQILLPILWLSILFPLCSIVPVFVVVIFGTQRVCAHQIWVLLTAYWLVTGHIAPLALLARSNLVLADPGISYP